jgi:hypothetical protein
VLLAGGLEDADALGHDFGADPVTWDQGDIKRRIHGRS